MKLKVLNSGSSGNCYLLQTQNETLIIECGIKWKDILKGLNYRIDNVACLISHCHGDHSKSINDVLKAGIDAYSSEGTFTRLETNNYHTRQMEGKKQVAIGDFTVLPFELEHDVTNLGFLIQHPECGKLIYLTDTYYCKYKFSGINHILIECNYSMEILKENVENGSLAPALAERIMKSHFSLEHVKEFLQANDLSQVKDIILLHLSDGNSNAKQFQSEIEGLTGKPVYIAQKGLEIEL